MLYDYRKESKSPMLLTLANGKTIEGEFIDLRIATETLPKGRLWYHIRHTDDDWSEPASLKNGCVVVNFCGTFICDPIIDFPCGEELEIKVWSSWADRHLAEWQCGAMLHIVVSTPFGNTFPMASTFIILACLASRSSSYIFIFDSQVSFCIYGISYFAMATGLLCSTSTGLLAIVFFASISPVLSVR